MPELGGNEFLKERMLRATGDRNVAAIGKRNHAQSVLEALFGGDVAGNDGNGADIQLG